MFTAFVLVFGSVLFAARTVETILEHYRQELPEVTSLSHYEPSLTTKIFSSDGQLIGTLYKENRTWTKLEEVSPHLKNAVLAIEDSRFYEHRGVDPKGVLRAIYVDVIKGSDRQGASTITMQLARALFLTPKQTIDRKIKEMLMAVEIEKAYTKDEILELYLNQIYLGAGAYGVHAASSLYFDKAPKTLTPAESSLIAGLPQAPSEYSPLVDEEAAKERQRVVLGRMLELNFLSAAEHQKALADIEKMKFRHKRKQQREVLKVPYFTSYVIKQLHKDFDEDFLYRGGLKIYTTVDLKLQKKAEKLVREMVKKDEPYLNVHTGSLVSIQNGTGFIKAMVGGTQWTKKNQFNRAWQARRQPGSSFKIFVYATAVECGWQPNFVIPDEPLKIDGWEPKNSDHRFMGAISMATAMQFSRNTVAVRLLKMCGVKRIIHLAHQMGIESELKEVPSLALGATDVSPLEMADAVSTLPNLGIRIPATPIKIIYDKDGNVVQDNRFPEKTDVLSEPTAISMMNMMRNVIHGGTAPRAYLQNHDAAGKTGTTDSFRDAWFVGYTRDYTTAVWVGNDDFSKMWRAYGGDLPAGIWHEYMKFALKDKKPTKLPTSRTNQVGLYLCADSKMRVGPLCPHVISETMPYWALPRRFCYTHGAPKVPKAEKRKEKPKTTETKEKPKETPKEEPLEGPVPTQIELPTEVPMVDPLELPPSGVSPIEAPPLEGLPPVDAPPPAEIPVEAPPPMEMIPPEPVDLPPPPAEVVMPVEVAPPPPAEVAPPPPVESAPPPVEAPPPPVEFEE